MKCRHCSYARRGWFKSVPEAYVCVGVPEPFVIKDYPDAKCIKYKDESVKDTINDGLCEVNYMEPEKYFAEQVEKYNMIDPLEILNWYRNLYYKENVGTEHRIMAEAINNLFMKYKDVFLRRGKLYEQQCVVGMGYQE